MNLFFPMWPVFVLWFFFSTRCQYYIELPFNCWQNRPDMWVCRNGTKKKTYQLHWVTYFCEMWSEEFIYRVFNLSVKILLMNRDEDPSFFLTSKVEEWLMMTFVLENWLLDLFVVLDLDLGSILIDNSFFSVSQKLEINIIYFICF
jgi:hypothetical protein